MRMHLRKLARSVGIKLPKEWYLARLQTEGTYCFIHINKCGGTSVEKALGLPLIHDTAQQRIAVLGRDRWDALTSFALVRHPYDKVVSHYKYRVKTDQTGMGDGHIGLNDWVIEAFGAQNPRYYDQPLMFKPCLDWLVDETGAVVVDRIMKLEEIDAEWPGFCQEVFGKPVNLGQHNTTARQSGLHRTDLSAEALAVLNRHFAQDFTQFGYEKADPDP